MAADTLAPAQIDRTHRYQLRAAQIEQTFTVDVALPNQVPDEPMPVIYTTDANMMFALIAQTARLLQLDQELPPALVVGIGYVETSPNEVLALRSRDLTPSVDRAYIQRSKDMGIEFSPQLQPGGAEAFLDFIQAEVKPLIQSNYNTSADQTLAGDSLGGLFALHTMFTQPQCFNRYLAGSPSLWWDRQMLFEAEKTALTQHPQDRFALDLFLSVGAEEESDPATAGWSQMVTNTHRLIERFQNSHYAQLRLSHHRFADETHVSVIPATFSRGLRALFRAETT